MPSFVYRAYDRAGALKEGTIEAESRARALEALAGRGELPTSVEEGAAAPPLPWWQRDITGANRLPRAQLALFTRELATLLQATLPLDDALRVLAMQPSLKPAMRRVATALLDAVSGGAALSRAMAVSTPPFPEAYWRLVEAGELAGKLPPVVADLAASLEHAEEMRARAMSALVYPAVLVVAAFLALGVIVGVLLPTLAPLFKDAGATPPPVLRALLTARDWLAANATLVAIAALAATAFPLVLARTPAARSALDALLLRLPVVGPFVARRDTAQFTRTLGTLMRNGVPVLDGVRIAAAACRNRAFRDRLAAMGADVAEGAGLTRPLRSTGLVPDLALRLVSIGEETGQLDAMLLRAAAAYESQHQRQIERLTTLIAPALTLLIGAVVGLLILSVMDAITSVNQLAIK